MDIICVPIIVICCYLIGEIYKLLFKKFDKSYKFIPLITIIFGGILAIIIYFTVPEVINAKNLYDALIIGFVSGASSTGANQIIKQLIENKGEN
jgi:hypothetical protein